MHYEIQLVMGDGVDYLKERIESSFSWLKEKGYCLTLHQRREKEAVILDINLDGPAVCGVFLPSDVVSIFQHQLAEILAEVITTRYEKDLVIRQVERKFKVLPPKERRLLSERAMAFLRRFEEKESLNLLLQWERKSKLSRRILEYMGSSQFLDMRGLLNFGVAEYLREIRFAVYLAYEDLKSEKQINEFIKLLRSFVNSQPSRVIEANVYYDGKNSLYLWDEKGLPIEKDLVQLFYQDSIKDCSMEDIMLSILVTLAPRRIVFHGLSYLKKDLTGTIARVFEDCVFFCLGCDRCQVLMNSKERG